MINPLDWNGLTQFKAEKRFLDGYPEDVRSFFAPRDDVHGLLVSLISSAAHSIVLNMFTYTDAVLNAAIRNQLASASVYVQISLDKGQSANSYEQALLKEWGDAVGNSIAIGNSSRGAYSHLKLLVVDGIYTVDGSTNWTSSAETRQDNSVRLFRDPVIAAESRAILDLNHTAMLKQQHRAKSGK